jgi:hypothetical protein
VLIVVMTTYMLVQILPAEQRVLFRACRNAKFRPVASGRIHARHGEVGALTRPTLGFPRPHDKEMLFK